MLTSILMSLVVFLGSVLGIGITIQYYAWEKRMEEKKRRNTKLWKTVFDRTDLKKDRKIKKVRKAA